MFILFYQLPSCNSFTCHMSILSNGETPLVHPWPPVHLSSSLLSLLLLLLLSNHCCFHPSSVTCASPGVAELTTRLRRPLGILWLPLCRINKLSYTSLEDCCDTLHLWVIKTIFWRRCRRAITLLIGSLGN